jgi:hypothetical protein
MASRDIWSKGGGEKMQDLLGSLLVTILLGDEKNSPLYLCSPYISDFRLLDNSFSQFGALFTDCAEIAEKSQILFSDVLLEISRRRPVRIVTTQHASSMGFSERVLAPNATNLSVRWAADIYHEKGLLCEEFYIEGSMNFTYSGVCIRDEKVSCHDGEDKEGRRKIDAAFLEFNRLWSNLADVAAQGAKR